MLETTALISFKTKVIVGSKTNISMMTVDDVSQVMEKNDGRITADISLVKVMKKHGKSLEETELVNGIVVDKEVAHVAMPKSVSNPGIALLNAKLEIEKTETEAKITINRPEEMHLFIEEEERLIREMVDDVAKSGAKVLFLEKGADDEALSLLGNKGILAVKNVSSGDMEKLEKATGASIVGTVKDVNKESLGQAKLVEEVQVG